MLLYGNAVVGQSGGPTAAINATLSGVIRGALSAKDDGIIGTLFGMRNGIEGLLSEELVDLFHIFDTEEKLTTLEATPAAALGSCRKRLKAPSIDADAYEKLFDIFRRYNIRYFFYIGGNDSMDTVLKLSEYSSELDWEMRFIGVPKTIDNDLAATDHTPGFGSAAKFVATTMKEILRDVSVYKIPAVTIVEVMGRDAGWLTASAALPALSGDAPDLIYLPERSFSPEEFIEDIKEIQKTKPAVLVAVSEGIRDENGRYVGEGTDSRAVDAFGHKALSGAGRVLEALVKEKIGCKVRSVELNLPQRCASHIASLTDIGESVMIGGAAVKAALVGSTGVMMTFERENSPEYSVRIATADINGIANEIRRVPEEYINDRGNGITEAGIAYLAPLILGELSPISENGMPRHIVI